MSPRIPLWMAACITFAVLSVDTGVAAEIRMNDGTVYYGVTIARRDAAAFECYSQSGRMLLPVMDVAKIDGIRIAEISPDRYPYVASLDDRPRATPVAPAPVPRPVPSLAPVATPAKKRTLPSPTPVPRTIIRSPAPVVAVSVARHSATPAPAAGTPAASPVPKARPRQGFGYFPWMLLGAIALVGLWVLSVFRVRRDLREAKGTGPRIWKGAVIALPIVGYFFYELARLWKRRGSGRHGTSMARREFVFLDANHRPIVVTLGEEASGLENAKGVLQDALLDRASDIHIEPGASECRVRFRIDGVLHPRMKFPAEDGLRLISALKTVAQLDIAERRKAQDGRFGGRTDNKDVDFRAATTPSVYGEKLVLRVLDQKIGLRGLSDLGMSQDMMSRFAEVIQSRSGMILATGPTGSGKTSSLYAALTQLDSIRLNIVTIEDPVEYELSGATQIPVNVKAGVTYESGLRSILRQDPDVILVGEMRDLEAGQIALRSALTGHLVFTSLHTKDAIGTIHRLEEMGLERHLLASALFVVMSQRLVRILCTACREAYPSTGHELEEIGIELPAGETVYRAVGCRRCDGSGYVGRTGIFEMLILDENLRQEINAGTPEADFTKLARKKGYRGYREDGAEKILLGITSADEVLKAT